MAEVDFESYDTGAGPHRSAQLAQAMNIAGAVCSIALVVGLGVWGYQLAVRDVNGVPVIRALAGPMREMPKTPGGNVASHQGLSVNAVVAVGIAASLPDQVLLAPTPVALAADDAPGLGMVPSVATPVADSVTAPVIDPATLPQVEVGTSAISPVSLAADATNSVSSIDTDAAVALALADALASGVAPFAELAAAPTDLAAAVPSTRPRPRPSQTAAVQNAGAVESAGVVDSGVATGAAPAEIDPATLEVGTRLVQLGAFDTETDARAEWVRLQTRFGDHLLNKSMVVQAAQSGGRTFYRLRAHGFAGEEDARLFCSVLVAANTPCIPALHR